MAAGLGRGAGIARWRRVSRNRPLGLLLTVSVVVSLVQALTVVASPLGAPALASPQTGTGGYFVPVQGQLINTRSTGGPYSTPMSPNVWRSATVSSVAGVPSTGVGAVQVTVSAIPNGGTGTVQLAKSQSTPVAQTVLNYGADGTHTSNTAIVAVGSDGQIDFRASTAADVIIDVQGYYTSGDPGEGGFVPMVPRRIVQTSTSVGLSGMFASGVARTVTIPASANVPVDASAVFVNIAISANGGQGFAAAYPSDPRPNVQLDYPAGVTTSIGTTVPLASDGTFKLFLNAGPADVSIDVSGYFDGSVTTGAFTPAQAQLATSRSIAAGATAVVQVSGVAGLPATGSGIVAAALDLQATVPSGNGGRLTVYPSSASRPGTSSLTVPAGTPGTFSNFATVQLGDDGAINVFNNTGVAVTLTVSTQGWYTNSGPPITNGQFQTQQSVSLQADPTQAAGYVSYWYRVGTVADPVLVPTARMTDGQGNHPAAAVIAKSGGAFPAYTWNVRDTLAALAGNNGVAPDALIQVEACYRSDPNAAGSCGGLVNVDFSQAGLGSATTSVGPGTVSETTGDYEISATDASVTAPLGGLSVGRTLTTLNPMDAGVAADSQRSDASGVFGPGWSADLFSGGHGDLRPKDHSVDGYLQFKSPDGSLLTFQQTTGTGSAYPLRYAGAAAAAASGLTAAKTDANTITLTDPDTTTTTWSNVSGSWRISSVKQPGANATTTYTFTAAGLPTRILAPVPAGVDCTNPDTTPGCRSLIMNYTTLTVGSTSVTRLEKIRFSAPQNGSDTTPIAIAAFDYGTDGLLADTYDPRITPKLITAYTYDTDGRLTGISPPGTATFPPKAVTTSLSYDSAGRLSTVSWPGPGGQTAIDTIVYGVPLSGAGLPDLTANTVGHWDQTSDLPVTGTAVFGPQHPPAGTTAAIVAASDWPWAAIDYADVNSQIVNTAGYGAGSWQISTTQYDNYGNDVWDLSPGNRAQALTPTSDTDPTVAAIASNVTRADRLAAATSYNPDKPWLTTDTYGPTHPMVLRDGTTIHARSHTATIYDEGAPYRNDADGGPYDFPTTVTTSGFDPATKTNTVFPDAQITHSGYDEIASGDPSGWTLATPTSSTIQMAASPSSSDLVTLTRYDANGRTLEVRLPGDSTGNGPRTTITTYYTATGTGPCVSAPLAGLVCSTSPAGQPATGAPLPVSSYTYNRYGDSITKTETYGTGSSQIVRATNTSYDNADRPMSHTITVTPTTAGGTALPVVSFGYDPQTGAPITVSTGAGPDIKTLTTAYDALGQVSSYTDSTGNTSTATYDLAGRPGTLNDGKGTYSYTYDTPTEHRGMPTSEDMGVTTAPSIFTANYDPAGNLAGQAYPNGLIATTGYDNTGQPTTLTYAKSGSSWMNFTQDHNPLGQIVRQTSPASSQVFQYDPADRLTIVNDTYQNTCITRSYSYDSHSNRTVQKVYPAANGGGCTNSTSPATITTSYDAADRDTNPGYTYDAIGRTTTIPAVDAQGAGSYASVTGNLTLGYYANDMVANQQQSTASKSFTLDPLQNRFVDNSDGSDSTINHYSGDTDSPAWTSSAVSWIRNIAGLTGGLNATQTDTGSVQLQLPNLHGDIVATCQDNTTVSTSDNYGEATEYGKPRNPATANTTIGWLGSTQRSTNTLGGLTLMGVRLYNANRGQFATVDSIPGGTANAYAYPQDPINSSDLTGQCAMRTAYCLRLLLTTFEPWPPGFRTWLERKVGTTGRHLNTRYANTAAGWRFMLINNDHCTDAPDTGVDFDFRNACDTHDLGYQLMTYMRLQGRMDRGAKTYVDNLFLQDMNSDCNRRSFLVRWDCRLMANTEYRFASRFANP